MSISKRASQISPSLTLAITAKAKKMSAEGISVIGFGAGEPDFNTPDYIIEAAKKALDDGMTKYTPAAGIMPLREAICAKLERDNGLSYAANQIVVSNGAKHSLFNVMEAIVDDGDEVIIPAPFWLTYPELVKMAGGVPVIVNTEEQNHFKITPDALRAAITDKTKAFILNSPSNPTGTVYEKEELFALAEVLEEAGIYVISDEIYEKLVYDGKKHYSIASYSEKLKEKTIVVNGMSKSYAMTGWRIGYLAAPLAIAKAIDSVQSHATSNPNSIAQYAALAALNGGEDFLSEMVKTFDERRKFMVERVNAIDGLSCKTPMGAFYVLVNVSELLGKKYGEKLVSNTVELADAMLEAGVAVVPGISFGADEYIRLSYAISLTDIEEGLKRIEGFVRDMTE